jgi:stress-induced morphogen
MSIEQSLRVKIEAQFEPTHLLVVNDSHGHSRGIETHFTVVVISPKFEGVSRLDRSRMVSELFDEERARGLHALTQKTFTPAEWEKIKDSFEYDPPACRGRGK